MELEYSIWNITNGWQPLRATTLESAAGELQSMDPYAEEAQVRNKATGQVWKCSPPRQQIHWGPFD